MKYLLEHFAGDTTISHADCCAFFATYAGESPPHPHHWEPHPEQFEADLTKIGYHVFDTKTGPGKDAISYAYLAFPKTKTATFTMDKFGCNQFNAGFRMAMDVLLGRPDGHPSHHGLLRLVNRNKPETKASPPIVFGAMGQTQWVWEMLHPLNNPGADWIVEWMGMTQQTTPVIVPNYYPDPHPHLLSTEDGPGVRPFKEAFNVIKDAVTEAFDEKTIARMDSIIVKGGEGGGIEIPTGRPYRLEERLQLAKEIQSLKDAYSSCLTIIPAWRAGESKLFPGWPSKPGIFTDFPPLNSRLGTLFKLVDSLCSATNNRRDWRRAKDAILLKSLPPWDSLETPKTESPAFLLTTETTQAEWLAIRSTITSCDVSVYLLKASEADWWRSIAKSNVWGARPDGDGSWFWDVYAWSEFSQHKIKQVDGRKSLPVPSELKREAKAATQELPFAKGSNVKVDGRDGTVKGKAKQRESAFESRRPYASTPLFGRPRSPFVSPGGLILPAPETQSGSGKPTAQAKSSSGVARRALENQSRRASQRLHAPSTQHSSTIQQAEHQTKPPLDAPTPQSPKLQLPAFLTSHSSSRRQPQPQPQSQRARERPRHGLSNDPEDRRSSVIEIEDKEERTNQSSEDPLQEEPTESPNQGRLPPDANLWGEDDDEPMRDVEEGAEEEAQEEGEPSEQEDRRPRVEFASDSEYGDDYASVASGPSDAPVTFPDRTSRFRPMEPINKDDRARTWATQPGIFEGWNPKAWPSCNGLDIPITAAPAEKVFRTSDSVPMFTKAVLTPNEQAELQSSFFGVRNIALKRTMQCPFQGCDFSHRLDEPEVIEQHTKLHQTNKCMWCDEPLFEWWSPEQRMDHLRKKHEGKLVRALGMKLPAGGNTAMSSSGSRKQQQPTASLGGLFGFGIPRSGQQQAFPQFGAQSVPRAPVADMTGTAYIQGAAAGSAQMKFQDTLEKVVDRLYTRLVSEGEIQGTQDMIHPLKKRFPAMHPSVYDPVEQQKLFDSFTPVRSTEAPRALTYPLAWHDYPGPIHHHDPPMTCPLPDCFANNFEYLRPRQIWEHFVEKHPDHTLDRCPFCNLPFIYTVDDKETGKKVKRQRPEEECIKHFDCHIWQLWDSLMPKGKYAKWDFQVDLPPPGPYRELAEIMTLEASRSEDANQKRGQKTSRPGEERREDANAQGEPAADTSDKNRECAFFEKCGAIVGSMTDKQYRRHMRDCHPKEVQMVDFDSQDGSEEEDEAPSPRTRTPAPTPRPALQSEATDAEDAQIDESNRHSTSTAKSGTSTSKKRKRNMKPRHQTASQGSEDELSGLASDTPSRSTRTRTRQKLVPVEMQPLEETDAYAPASESRSSATQGRARPTKKSRKDRPPRDNDGEYEDDGASTDDEPEEESQEPKRPRRARSPDWVKRLGPGDPDFEPSDDMYCSKCLRKAPKSGNKSPSRSPLGREKELEYHSDLNRCCRIRNGKGHPENLPNHSGWIRAADLPAKLGQIKSRFTSKYPAYDRTIYPTKASDNNASVWRSDPNNEDNEPFWNMPWPPYEGQPPFPGEWEDPGMPAVGRGRKKRRDSWQGRAENDPLYTYQSDEDTDDDLKPDEDDIAELQEEASNDNSSASGLKRRRTGEAVNTPAGSGVDTGAEEDEDAGPATKKAKKTPAGELYP